MNRKEFVESISAYLDGDLDVDQKKEFEVLILEDSYCRLKLEEFEHLINSIKETPQVETSRNFTVNLNDRIDEYEKSKSSFMQRIQSNFKDLLQNSGLKLGFAMSFLFIFSFSYFYWLSDTYQVDMVEGDLLPKDNNKQYIYTSDSDSLYDEYQNDIELTSGTE